MLIRVTEGGFYYSSYDYSASEHGGTHLDSPIHFYKNRKTTDEISLEQLIGKAVMIRITGKVKKNRNYQLLARDVLQWEKKNGKITKSS